MWIHSSKYFYREMSINVSYDKIFSFMEKPLNKYERNKYKFLNTVFSLLGKVP